MARLAGLLKEQQHATECILASRKASVVCSAWVQHPELNMAQIFVHQWIETGVIDDFSF